MDSHKERLPALFIDLHKIYPEKKKNPKIYFISFLRTEQVI